MTRGYKSPISLILYERLLSGGSSLGEYTAPFAATWRRSKARLGGCKIGSVSLTTADLTSREMGELFRHGLLREVRELGGGRLTWQGVITRMEWTHQGDVFISDINTMSNARRALYRRLFDNLLINGSAESGAWASFNGATVTQSAEWVTDGVYSCKIVVADAVKRGAMIQTGIAITANVVYVFTARMKIVSGSWAIEAYRSDNNARLVRYDSAGAIGTIVPTFTIPDTNAYTGSIYLRVSSIPAAGAGACYLDAAVFKGADQPSDTGWQVDANAVRYYGRKEQIDLWGGLSAAAADSHVALDLVETAWPQPDTPTSGTTRQAEVDPKNDKLSIVFAGYWITLNWIYTRLTGSAAASALVNTLVGYQADYLAAGTITTNNLSYTIEDSSPLRCGDVLKEIADSGDAIRNKWSIGVWQNRRVDYRVVDPVLTYHLRGGRLLNIGGGDAEPWLALPGWAHVDDLPIGPGNSASTQVRNNPRWRYLEEVEMLPPDNDHPDYWLAYSRESV